MLGSVLKIRSEWISIWQGFKADYGYGVVVIYGLPAMGTIMYGVGGSLHI